MRIPIHDHDKRPEGGIYCPLMKERCYSGWTPSMGVNNDEAKTKPLCVRWVGIFVNNPIKGKIEEVFDCRDRWDTDLIQQVAQEVYQGAVATEEVRNKVAEANSMTGVALSFFQGIASRMRAKVVLPEPKKPAALENGKGEPPL